MNTIWGDLKQGDSIRALDGSVWHVEWITHYNVLTSLPAKVEAGIHNGEERLTETRLASEPVERVSNVAQVLVDGVPYQTMQVFDTWDEANAAHQRGEIADQEKFAVRGTDSADKPTALDFTGNDTKWDYGVSQEVEKVTEAFAPHTVELIATETDTETEAREAATKDEPLVLPVITSPLKLRSHLYLLHGYKAINTPDPLTPDRLEERHRECHVDGPMENPHVHLGLEQEET